MDRVIFPTLNRNSSRSRAYNKMIPWIVICKLLGLFPYENVRRGHFPLKRQAYFYFYFSLSLFFQFCNEVYYNSFRTNYGYYGFFLGGLELMLSCFWSKTWIGNNDKLLSLLEDFDQFDLQLQMGISINFDDSKMYKDKWVLLIIAAVLCDFAIVTYVATYLTGNITISIIVATSKLTHRFLSTMFLVLYMHLLSEIINRYEKLNNLWTSSRQFSSCNIHRYRSLYAKLSNIMDGINECLGSRILILYVQLFYIILAVFFVACASGKIHLFYIISPVFLVFITTYMAQNVISSTSSVLKSVICKRNLNASEETVMQIRMFMLQIGTRPPEISAAGYFTVNRHLLNSMALALATYLIMIFQLTPLMKAVGDKTNVSID